jgi:nucleotide-binding universal stress UspA family protein
MKILHPTDFSECAVEAERHAVRLVKDLDGEIVLVQVLAETPLYSEGLLNIREAQTIYDAQRKWVEDTLEARCEQLRQSGIKARWRLEVGVPFEEIVKVAEEEHADMIVMGTHGRSGLNRLLLGSVADRVIRLASCPVVTVRQKKAGAA